MTILNKKLNRKVLPIAVIAAMGFMTVSNVSADIGHTAKPAINFSFAVAPQAKLAMNTQSVETQSNEYWFTVNGKQLNAGVDVHTSVAGALIKISRQSKGNNKLHSESLRLLSATQPKLNLAANVIKEDDLKATGVFENATAIKMDNAVGPGTFKLSYAEPLVSDNLYVIHVKEKHAASKLLLSTRKQHITQGENLNFNALMQTNDATMVMQSVSAFIVAPSGKKFDVPVSQLKNGATQVLASAFANSNGEIEAPINGLHELHFNGVALIDGKQVHRTGKIAFAFAPKTATLKQRLLTRVNAAKPQADFALTVNEPGRYEVRGILYGHDSRGALKPIMETHSAQNLNVGAQSITMKFDQELLRQSVLAAPYVVKQVRLYDQSRMSRL
jgi:hypothetical protein